MNRKIRIAFAAIHYPVTIARYFWQALLRRDDVEVWSFGPFTNTLIPWSDPVTGVAGMHLPASYVRRPDFPMPFTVPPTLNYNMAQVNVPWEPDLWLECNAALTVLGRPVGGKYAVVGTDPHVCPYNEARRDADFFFNMQPTYRQQGDILLPYAYDPVWARPTEVPWAERTQDTAIVGLHYTHRTALIDRLTRLHISSVYTIGPSYQDYEAIYHQTRVGLNWSSLQDMNAKVFELLAFRIPLVANRIPALDLYFREEEHYLGFNTVDEAVGCVERLLADPVKAQEMAVRGRIAVEPHTYDARVQTILEATGLAPGDRIKPR